MRETHEIITCDRCGNWVAVNRTKGESYEEKLSGWGEQFPRTDLCPECYKLYLEMMNRFYGKADAAGEADGGVQNDGEKSHH